MYAIAKISIRKLFIYPHLSESQEVKNDWKVSVKGGYKRSEFGYKLLYEMAALKLKEVEL